MTSGSAAASGAWLRLAGRGRLADGAGVTWTLAEGVRGRRWRWIVEASGIVWHAGLIEIDPAGRFARLELASAVGLLTLHPEADRASAHGNVVRLGGVTPIDIPWTADDAITIEADPFGTAVAGWRGRGWVVGTDLMPRRDATTSSVACELDERGVPLLRDAREWPLEA